jgi:phosphate transport system substrate-binding protein
MEKIYIYWKISEGRVIYKVKIITDKKRQSMIILLTVITTGTLTLSGCIENQTNGGQLPKLIQTGSSTVLPLAIAWAEEFDGADISVSGGGSSHGLNALLKGEADLGDASRLLKGSDYKKVGCAPDFVNEDGTAQEACGGVLPIKWVVAYDVLVIVVNNENDWATNLNYSQLYEIFTDDSPAIYWDEVTGLNQTAPHEEIEIYASDEASGTYDFFFEEIIPNWGKDEQQASTRLDSGDGVYHPSADDNVILNAIKENKYAIGYFGFAYYKENPTLVTPVWIAEEETDYEEPSLTNTANYPMARPLHIYTNGIPDSENVINDYIRFIFSEEGQDVVPEVGYVRLNLVDEDLITEQLARLD